MFDAVSYHDIPTGLAHIDAGPVLGAFLSSIDVTRVSPEDRIVVLRAHQRMLSHHQAHTFSAMAAVVDHYETVTDDIALAQDGATVEIATALRLTRRAATESVDLAIRLRDRLPAVARLLETGALDPRRARVLVEGTDHLPPDEARRVLDQILPHAPGLTTGQIGSRVRRLCVAENPAESALRYDAAVEERRLVARQGPDGAIDLMGLDLPAERGASISRSIDRIARSLRRTGDGRTMDQLRADVFLDLLEGTSTGEIDRNGVVDITVPLTTLAGLSEEPGELNGFGPVVADVARNVVSQQHDAQWRFTVTHPETGHLICAGTTRRRPDAATARAVEARHRRCVFPGCRMPSIDCDLDHGTPWADGGPTCECNLAPLCRYHHTRRHDHGWSYRRVSGADHEWISPLGFHYLTSGRSP